jgi:anti-sigma B factor antagonist
MDITQKTSGGCQTIVLRGEIDLYNSPDLGAALQKSVQEEISAVYVDMQEVTYMDSSGLGVLISAANRLVKNSRQLFLVRPSLQVLRLLEMTRLLTFFRIVFEREAGGQPAA